MEKIVEKTWLLSFDELRILLYSQGYRQCEGIYMPEKAFTQDEVLQAMFQMSKRGLLTEQDGEFVMRQELAEMVQIIGAPSGTMILRSEREGQDYFCYIVPAHIVVSEKSRTKEDILRLRAFSPEAFTEWKELTIR